MNRTQLALMIVTASLPVLAPASAADTVRERSERDLDVTGIRTLRVENARGTVDLRPSDNGRLRLSALKVAKASRESQARETSAETQVETGREGDAFIVKVRYPRQRNIRIGLVDLLRGYEPPWVEVRLSIDVPAGLDVDAQASSGDLSSTGLAGAQVLETASGDVTVTGARGRLQVSTSSGDVNLSETRETNVRTVSGDVTAEGVRGALSIRAASGDVLVNGADDTIAVRTTNGDIRVDAAPRGIEAGTRNGELVVRSASGRVVLSGSDGSIQVHLAAPLRSAEVTSVSGDITAHLSDDVGCRVDMRTSSGDLSVSIPIELKTVSRRHVAGVIRGGKAPVLLKSSAGDIELLDGGM